MKYRNFADTGWKVSEIGLGCWGIGGTWADVSDATAKKILKKSLDNGVNFFDTSDAYGNGRSEKLLGNFFKLSRTNIYITTKILTLLKPKIPERYKIEIFEKFIDRSLKNLKTEAIDLLQLHCPPKQLLETYYLHEIMEKLVKKGKVRYYGVSVFSLEEAYAAIQFENVKSIQLVFNILRQNSKKKFFKEAESKNVAIIARGSLVSGLLSGTINKNTKFAPSDHRNFNLKGKYFNIAETFSGIPLEVSFKILEKLKKLIPNNITLIELALKWILTHKEITVVIPGAINSLQVELNTVASNNKNIKNLMSEIKAIYDEFAKPYDIYV